MRRSRPNPPPYRPEPQVTTPANIMSIPDASVTGPGIVTVPYPPKPGRTLRLP